MDEKRWAGSILISNLFIFAFILVYFEGDFVVTEPIEEGNKVKAEIVQILTKEHIRYIKSQGMW